MQVPFPEWVSSNSPGAEALDAQAEIAIRPGRLAHVAKPHKWAAAAKMACRRLAAGLRFGPKEPTAPSWKPKNYPRKPPGAPSRRSPAHAMPWPAWRWLN